MRLLFLLLLVCGPGSAVPTRLGACSRRCWSWFSIWLLWYCSTIGGFGLYDGVGFSGVLDLTGCPLVFSFWPDARVVVCSERLSAWSLWLVWIFSWSRHWISAIGGRPVAVSWWLAFSSMKLNVRRWFRRRRARSVGTQAEMVHGALSARESFLTTLVLQSSMADYRVPQ